MHFRKKLAKEEFVDSSRIEDLDEYLEEHWDSVGVAVGYGDWEVEDAY